MDSQFGLMNVWNQGDFVTRAVALLLIGMSLASWIVILIKALDVIRYKRLAKHSQDFWHSEDFATALEQARQGRRQPVPRAGAGGPRSGGAPSQHQGRICTTRST